MEAGSFQQIAAILALAVGVGVLATRLRQPLIVAFIAVGIAVGPSGLGWVARGDEDQIELLAGLGIAILLFLVGLKLDVHLVRTTGPVALATGLGQVIFTSGIGFLIGRALGLDPVTAVYVAIALTFSSTIIIVKLLSDKREIDHLHGRIAVGFLIVQDIVVILVMIAITAVGAGGDAGWSSELLGVFGRGIAFLTGIGICIRWVLPWLLPKIARSRELLVLFALAWAIAVSATGEHLGLSGEVGAFLAGFALASTPYREAIGGRLVSVRDFLLLFFFIHLGSQMQIGETGAGIAEAGILAAFVLIGNPIIVMLIMRFMNYPTKVSFPAGLTVAQISEFSLILVALGIAVGHIGSETLGLVTLVGLITIGLSTYLILYWQPLYERLEPALRIFEQTSPRTPPHPEPPAYDVVILGAGRYGRLIVERLREAGVRLLVIDIDPQALASCRGRGATTLYGDAEDPELVTSLPLHDVDWVVSAIPDVGANTALLHALEATGYRGQIAVTAHRRADARRLAELAPAAQVLLPFEHGVDPVVELVTSPKDVPSPKDVASPEDTEST